MIIKFSGKLSNSLLDKIIKENRKFIRICCLFGAIFSWPICIITSNMVDAGMAFWLPFSAIMSCALVIGCEFAVRKDYPAHLIPVSIKISPAEDLISSENEQSFMVKRFSLVNRVIDYGDWYLISYGSKSILKGFICQKDLIVEGTLEDFEKIFEGKIEQVE